jgi:hypothetical protein
MTDPFPSFNMIKPFDRPLSTKTMKSICKWADRNKDGQLSNTEIDRAKQRLIQMKYTPQQQAQQEQTLGVSYQHYGDRYGHYLDAALDAAAEIAYRQPVYPAPTHYSFSIKDIDKISRADRNPNTISRMDWNQYLGLG